MLGEVGIRTEKNDYTPKEGEREKKKKSVYCLYDSSLTLNIQEYENKTITFYEPYFSYIREKSWMILPF